MQAKVKPSERKIAGAAQFCGAAARDYAERANTLLTVWACQRCGILLAKLDYHLYLDRNVENQ